MNSFWGESKKRNVFKVAVAYAIAAWLLVQVVVAVETPLSLPTWTDTLVIVLVGVGFPVVLIMAWVFELTAEGIKPVQTDHTSTDMADTADSVVTETRRPYELTWDEQARVFSKFSDGYLQGLAIFAVNTGATEKEIRSLRWAWETPVPEYDTSVFVIPARNDERLGRLVVLNSVAQRALGYQRDRHSEFVFVGNSGHPFTNLKKPWAEAWDAANMPSERGIMTGIENLRFTFEHRLRAAGVSAEDTGTLMGTIRQYERYSQLDIGHLLGCAERIVDNRDLTIIRG